MAAGQVPVGLWLQPYKGIRVQGLVEGAVLGTSQPCIHGEQHFHPGPRHGPGATHHPCREEGMGMGDGGDAVWAARDSLFNAILGWDKQEKFASAQSRQWAGYL